ncbi:MAG: VacJ family lipoprotein [Desulfobacteraceae bacterium]|jgi:phospholipid-binding lipoprotein MlaA
MKKIIFFVVIFAFFSTSFISYAEETSENSKSFEDSLFEEINADYSTKDSDFSDDELLDDELFKDEYSDKKKSAKDSIDDYDPIEPVNRAIFYFNDKVYIYVFTPVAKGYVNATPKFARTGIKNFFSNLASPLKVVNNLLQGKVKNAGKETGRFFVNTFLGFLGFIDSASSIESLNPPDEDLGQTFGRWGIGNGPYIVLPFLGPSTLRDTIGMAGEFYINPVDYALDIDNEGKLAMSAVNGLNELPGRMELYKTLKDSALDPYTAAKNAYIQLRHEQVKK